MSQTPALNYSGVYSDETYCTRGLCGHPSCWDSHVRSSRGFHKYATNTSISPHNSLQYENEDDLATYKVYNMLDDYGNSEKDLFPTTGAKSTIPGLYKHLSKGGVAQPNAPVSSPLKERSLEDLRLPTEKVEPPAYSSVEVQEVFDIDELNQAWDATFITKPVYVWIPDPRRRRDRKRSRARNHEATSSSSIVPTADIVNVKNVTDDLFPRNEDESPYSRIKPRSRSPLPTGGQPYKNVGQTPKDRMRYKSIMEDLKELPRPFILEVLEKTKGMKNKEEILLLMERYLKSMPKSDYEMSMVTGQVLQQRPLDSLQSVSQVERTINTAQRDRVFKLDEATMPDSVEPVIATQTHIDERRPYKRLPKISAGSMYKRSTRRKPIRVHVSTTTHESVKPFQYHKQPDVQFKLGPTRSLPSLAGGSRPDSLRLTASPAGSGNDTARGASNRGDMSVLYDAESVKRNFNNNNMLPLKEGGSPESSATNHPKPPNPTPYTPQTPAVNIRNSSSQRSHRLKAEGVNVCKEPPENPPPAAGLAAIDEAAGADGQGSRPTARAPEPANRQSLADPQTVDKRTRSAGILGQMKPIESNVYRSRSLDWNTTVEKTGIKTLIPPIVEPQPEPHRTAEPPRADEPARAGGLPRVDEPPGAASRATSRLDVQSTTSNWPIVDEDEILRAQTTPKPLTPAEDRRRSAPIVRKPQDKATRPKTQPNAGRLSKTPPVEPQKQKIVIDLQSQTGNEAPRPPPPSPEPEEKQRDRTIMEEPGPHEEAESTVRADDSRPVVVETESLNSRASEPKQMESTLASAELTQANQGDINLGDINQVDENHGGPFKEFSEDLKTRSKEVDALTILPDYKLIDDDREFTLSALPPSRLESTPQTPHMLSTVETRPSLEEVVEETQPGVTATKTTENQATENQATGNESTADQAAVGSAGRPKVNATAETTNSATSESKKPTLSGATSAAAKRPESRELPALVEAMSLEDQGGFAG